MQEVWLPVVGWEGLYEVSDQGRVKSLARTCRSSFGAIRTVAERIMKPSPSSKGYLQLILSRDGVQTGRSVHSLVAEAFIGPRPEGMEVRHGDSGQLDNSLANLCYGTPAENASDRLRDGTHNEGERHPMAKLTVAQVRHIRQQLENGPLGTAARLARELGVSKTAIGSIKRGKTWANA
jgi:hypothetical protein